MPYEFERTHRLAVLGGGPGGYEAALTGAQLGADVTLVERAGVGGSAVLTDVVPSKTLIATAEAATAVGEAADLGVQFFTRNDKGRPVRTAHADTPFEYTGSVKPETSAQCPGSSAQ